MQAGPDYYGVLGVSREATAAEIKAAFLKLATVFHAAGKPKNIDDVEEIRRYATAYRALSDPKRRAFYDQTGFRPVETELAGGMLEVPDLFGSVADGVEIAAMLAEVLSGL